MESESGVLQNKREKLTRLCKAGKDPFLQVKYDVNAKALEIRQNFEKIENVEKSVAGRIMTKRLTGKAAFFDLLDASGRIQIFVGKSVVGDDLFDEFKSDFDIGDIVGVSGTVFKTQKGEISLRAQSMVLLSKNLRVLPEKFHGLKDQETRYRQRYVDLIVNPEVRDAFIKRTEIIKAIREFLDARNFLEVETPVLQTIYGGASARPFKTKHNAHNLDMYLRIALELPLKRLIVGGLERVYEIGRVFRNEGISIKHNPEFTLLELYEAYTDYYGVMELTESMMKFCAEKVLGTLKFPYGEREIDFSRPFERITMIEAVKKYAGIDFDGIPDTKAAQDAARERQIEFEPYFTKGDILNLFFEKFVEDNLIQPTFVLDHPIEISPLTKKKKDNPDYAERFELFILGNEFANAYSELNDPNDQRERFNYQEFLREKGNAEANMIDEDFIEALEYGMPPTGGLGVGIDRFVMLLTNSFSIRDVLLFPTMKPL
jgi:lysyl-tRNA synthetase class 2